MDPTNSEADDEPLERPQKVPRSWLEGFESSDEARRLAQLEADSELLDRLMWAGYAGPEYDRFEERLARYGLSVMTAWCRSGAVFARCAAKGWRLSGKPMDRDDAAGLADLTVAIALHKFRETVLIPRVWDYRRGASIKSFFIGQCLLRFLNEYRAWERSESDAVPLWRDPTPPDTASPNPGPAALLISIETRDLLLSQASDDPLTREIAYYRVAGYSNAEIAELTGLQLSAVKSRLHRLRRKGPHAA